MEPVPLRAGRHASWRLAAFATAALVVAACGSINPEPSAGATAATSGPTAPASTDASPSEVTAAATPRDVPAPSGSAIVDSRPFATSGTIALVRADGSMWLVDTDGRTTPLASAGAGTYGFPTWSPDGRSIASIRTASSEAAIDVFDAEHAVSGVPSPPRTIFDSATIGPFYLSWTPDGRSVSFLANDGDTLALRIAPADGSAPLDGSGPGAVIRKGSPLYFDWIDADHLIAHVGDGPTAFLGEIGRDGAATGPVIGRPGGFRSVDVSADGRYVGYVRAGSGGADAVVAAARVGSGERTMPVFGLGALDFAPADDRLAAIGATEAQAAPPGLPVGPLRVLDAVTGSVTTLLEGPVLSFAWSPDGSTIAAIEVVPVAGASNVSSASPAAASPSPGQATEVRLAFVDAATGRIRSQPRISPGRTYVAALMTYFDQYALSHRLWAPDSSSILLPQVDPDGRTHVDVVFPDGGPSASLDGEIGFWSP